MSVSNKTFIHNKIPTGVPVPGEHLVVQDRPVDLSAAPQGGIIVEVQYASYDPYLRGLLRDTKVASYFPAIPEGNPISNSTVGRVIKSASPDFAEGDLVTAFTPIAEYVVIPDPAKQVVRKVTNSHGFDPAVFIGPLGMPGLTAYSGLYQIGKPKKGETIFISSAAGAVGQVVGMIAKHEGLTVVGSVGSDAKADFITKELGFDAAFNYKKESVYDALPRLCPKGIDIYWENVGGEHLEAALDNMNNGGRIPVCGMISGYNTPAEQRYGVKNLFLLVAKLITMQGFLQGQPEFQAYREEFMKNVEGWMADGSFKPKLHVTEGIDNAAEGFVGMLKGDNFGKAVLKIKQ